MIGEKSFEFSKDQAITAASAYSTNETPVSSLLSDFGSGEPFYIVFNITEAFVAASGAPSLIFHLILDYSPAHTGLALTFIGSSIAYLAADLTLGQTIVVPVMPLSDAQRNAMKSAQDIGIPLKYFGAWYQLGGSGTFSAGKITAFGTRTPHSAMTAKHYGDATN